jgi:S-methylmethionine-dependent homocysteine/selenocysteine methylase
MHATRNIILLDGGMSLELSQRSSNRTPRRWSAEYLVEEPDLVREVHADYIRAGAKVITTNTYSSTFTRMAMVNAEGEVPRMQQIACRLAQEARDQAGQSGADIMIAGGLPPLNGTYRPDRVRAFDINLAEYRRLVELQAPHVDLFLCETMSTGEEALSAAQAACETGKPVWVSWSLQDDAPRLRSGETIEEAAAMLHKLDISALLANCSSPECIGRAMDDLVATGSPCGGYANAFTFIPLTYTPGKTREQLTTRQDLGPDIYARLVLDWVRNGASIVGGCCEVGPRHIAALRDALIQNGFVLTSRLDRGSPARATA